MKYNSNKIKNLMVLIVTLFIMIIMIVGVLKNMKNSVKYYNEIYSVEIIDIEKIIVFDYDLKGRKNNEIITINDDKEISKIMSLFRKSERYYPDHPTFIKTYSIEIIKKDHSVIQFNFSIRKNDNKNIYIYLGSLKLISKDLYVYFDEKIGFD